MTEAGEEFDGEAISRFFGRHIVAIVGTYVQLDEKGEFIPPLRLYSYSAFVIDVNGQWYLATAGHVLKSLKKGSDSKLIKIDRRLLVDCFGEGSHREPIPFNPVEQPIFFIDNQDIGVDFGLIPLRDHDRALLETNKIEPIPQDNWGDPFADFFEFFLLMGFPDEDQEIEAAKTPTDTDMASMAPAILALTREDDDSGRTYRRFKGRIKNLGGLTSVVGMSGGPVFGFWQKNGELRYRLVAVQSTWDDEGKQHVFACPIWQCHEVAVKRLREELGQPNV